MRKLFIILFVFHFSNLPGLSQETPPAGTEQQLENLTDADQAETEDDSYLQQLEQFRKNPLNLNTADENDLKELKILTGLQIENFILYRKHFGKLVSIYELQAIPAWDISTIKKLLPFIEISNALTVKEEFAKRLKNGDNTLLLRISQVIEKAKGFDETVPGTKYLGGPQKIFFRYRYQYKNLLQYGLVGDKDAGEQIFKGAQHKGFDFYSFHFFARKFGMVQSLALGDFTVNMGQGLIQWQSLAFRKGPEVMHIKRQSTVLRPYNSAGEFNFHRGAGLTVKNGKTEATIFASVRKLSANFVADTVSNEEFISSFLNSGFHRTENEIADRNKLRQLAFGGNVTYKDDRWHVGLNSIFFNFSLPVQKREEPYNFFAISGKNWSNFSVDYSYTYRNLHLFGEAAADKNFNKAFINGLMVSVDPRVDISFLQRIISKEFQSINGNAFTENTYPTNENGWFAGISIRPAAAWRIDGYLDIFKFPWLKFLVDAPSPGKGFLTQLTYSPNKQVEIYSRFRTETKQTNFPDNTTITNYLISTPRQNWRTQIMFKINTSVSVRNRVELLWYGKKTEPHDPVSLTVPAEQGFLTFFDFLLKPLLKPYSGNFRLQYFETDGYNSRVYAYENDVLFYYSIPVFFDKGFRYYINLNYDLSKKTSFWFKWSQTLYRDKQSIGSGLDEIAGSSRSEARILIRIIF